MIVFNSKTNVSVGPEEIPDVTSSNTIYFWLSEGKWFQPKYLNIPFLAICSLIHTRFTGDLETKII